MNKNKNRGSQQRPRYGRPDSDQHSKNQAQYSRYFAFGKEALSQGDKVEAERNFQYAEHYVRMLGSVLTQQDNRSESSENSKDTSDEMDTSAFPIQWSEENESEENLDSQNSQERKPRPRHRSTSPSKKGSESNSYEDASEKKPVRKRGSTSRSAFHDA